MQAWVVWQLPGCSGLLTATHSQSISQMPQRACCSVWTWRTICAANIERAAANGLPRSRLEFSPRARNGVADFYRGKELRLVIGASVGGGYATSVAPSPSIWAEHVPGDNLDRAHGTFEADGGLAAMIS